MPSKIVNFQFPPAAVQRLQATRASTGLSHVANLDWGLKKWIEAGCLADSLIFSEETPGRKQKVLKLPAETYANLSMIREKTGLPLWMVADGALYYCGICRPPGAFTRPKNPLLGAICDEDLIVELASRGYRIDKD